MIARSSIERGKKEKRESVTQVSPDGGNDNELRILQVQHLVLTIFRLFERIGCQQSGPHVSNKDLQGNRDLSCRA